MLCLIDEPLGCAKTFCPDSWVVACCHISYAVKDKIAISKATVANYFPTLMFKTLKKFERLKKNPNKFRITKSDRLAQSFLLHEIKNRRYT